LISRLGDLKTREIRTLLALRSDFTRGKKPFSMPYPGRPQRRAQERSVFARGFSCGKSLRGLQNLRNTYFRFCETNLIEEKRLFVNGLPWKALEPSAAQERPRATHERLKSSQGRPNSDQERPKSSQERPKSGQKRSKSSQEQQFVSAN
jgi:hypothetical protein